MKAQPAAQQRLLDLQAVDTAVAQLEHRVHGLPIHQVIAQLAAARTAVRDELTAAKTVSSDATAERVRAEQDVIPARERLVRNQKRVDDGLVDARALTQLLDEIEHLKQRIVNLEDLQLEAEEAEEQAAASVTEITGRIEQIEADLKVALAEREQVVVEARSELKELKASRAAVVAGLPEDLVGLYDRLRERYHGLGAGQLVGQRCTACGLEATTADYNAYRAAAADEVLRCAECERILVRSAP